MSFLEREVFLRAIEAGGTPDMALRKQYVSVIERADGETGGGDRARRFIISTESPDRDNDCISASGWQLDNYRKNPVVLFAHDYSSLPIAKCTDITLAKGQLVATAEFADHDMANTCLKLIDGGFLNATSVGFRPLKFAQNAARGGVDFEEQELLEFSVVPVPANPEALIVARSMLAAARADHDPYSRPRKHASVWHYLDNEPVLEVADGPIVCDSDDVFEILRQVVPNQISGVVISTVERVVPTTVQSTIDRLRGRIVEEDYFEITDPLHDPAMRRHARRRF